MSRIKDINKLNLKNERQKCSDKNCYKSEIEAAKIADEQELLNWNQNLKLKVYRCHICGFYHLTRSSGDL